jgi:hypothetical protein
MPPPVASHELIDRRQWRGMIAALLAGAVVIFTLLIAVALLLRR